MPRLNLSDRTIKALPPAPKGKRVDYMDRGFRGFGVRVSDRATGNGKAAQRTFILVARYPGGNKKNTDKINPTRRSLGEYLDGDKNTDDQETAGRRLTLAQARAKARHWLDLIGRGIDPADEVKREVEAEAERREQTFGAMVEDYVARHLKGQRKAAVAEREIRRELLPVLGHKPVGEVTRRDVVTLIEAIADRPAKYQAINVLGHLRAAFNWAIVRGVYGLETSPCDRLRPVSLIGAKEPRQRVLSDAELAAYWNASGKYPWGPMYRMLALTGQRKSDVSDACWREFDLPGKRWVIPAARFKSGVDHIVPLSDEAISILEGLPRFTAGDFLFSASLGEKPVSGFSRAKARLDGRMRDELGELEPFVIHDVRRTVRTRLASLRVPDSIAEMTIGHGKRGLARVYDQHQYLDEMREALAAWAVRLRSIVSPPADNVVALREPA